MMFLNEMNGQPLPNCTNQEGHAWEVLRKPQGNSSGYWEEKCLFCGLEISYDDSD